MIAGILAIRTRDAFTAPANSDGRPAVYGVRPEHFTIADDGAEAEIVVVEPTGSETHLTASLDGQDIVCVSRERLRSRAGESVSLSFCEGALQFFDPTTGLAISGR